MGEKAGVVVVRFKKVQPPPVEKSSIPAIVPQAAELSRRPDFEPPPLPEKKQPQTVTYQSQDLGMDQVIYIVKSLGLNLLLSHL